MNSRGAKGMTLLELLVAMALFALLATASYTALQQGITTQDRLQETRVFWRRLESVFSLIERDLIQARNRAPRKPGRREARAFQAGVAGSGGAGEELFRFTRGGHTSFREGPVSPYLRIAYRFREGKLQRVTWPRLDAPAGAQPREATLLSDLSETEVRFFHPEENRWVERWPPLATEQAAPLPVAVELTLEFEDHGRYKRLFHVGAPR
ncbi:MAG: type II secretion system minor pseudopilin GspJ [Thiohalorhabdaceae bacterium]